MEWVSIVIARSVSDVAISIPSNVILRERSDRRISVVEGNEEIATSFGGRTRNDRNIGTGL
jgi:hypothetical protein